MSKILIVEDNEMNRDMLSRRLQKKNFEILIAINGKEGVEIAKRERPDLILMDMSLPVMDGWEAVKILKGQSDTAKIPIIALTAHAMSDDRAKCLAIGCDDFEAKPFDFPHLLEKIERFL